MDIQALTALATKIYGFVKPVIKSELGQEIAGDFKDATKGSMRELWQKVKPIFIIDDNESEELKGVKSDPENPLVDDVFLTKLRLKLSKDQTLREELEAMLNQLEQSDDPAVGVVIKHSVVQKSNFGNFSNVQGGIQFGDNIGTPPKKKD